MNNKRMQIGCYVDGCRGDDRSMVANVCADLLAQHAAPGAHDLIKKLKGEGDEDLDSLIEEACDVLWDYAPPYCHVGYENGDYGVWVDLDSVREDMRTGALPDYQAVEEDYRGYAVNVSDHGNISLVLCQDGTDESVWGIV